LSLPNIEQKIAFLSRPETYPEPTSRVETKETHMSWGFLTDTQAWKLKKPVWYDFLDFSTLEARRRNCQEELMTASEYRKRLTDDIRANRRELEKPDYALPADLLESITRAQLEFLEQEQELLDRRAQNGKIIEAHGDLRPEHICLEREPVIIDCLEFNRDFRILDTASELAFLALECERLGAPQVGDLILETYSDETGDRPPVQLLAFYKSYHACLRAKIAVWHLKDHVINDAAKWTGRARHYLHLAACGASIS